MPFKNFPEASPDKFLVVEWDRGLTAMDVDAALVELQGHGALYVLLTLVDTETGEFTLRTEPES